MTRNIRYEWDQGSSFGIYKVTINHAFLGEKSSVSRYILMLPIWLLLVLVVTVAASITTKVMRTKSRKKHRREDTKSS